MADSSVTNEERRAAVRQALGALSVMWPMGIVAVDTEGLSWYHNQRWEDACGAAGIAMRGEPWYIAVHPEDVASVASGWRSSVGRRGRFGPFRAVSADGAVHRCRGETVPMVAADGTLHGYLITVADADNEAGVPALSTAHLLDAVLDRAHDIITILNPDGTWRWSSGAALRMIGHQAAFDPAAGITPFMHPDEIEQALETIARVLTEGVGEDERFVFRLRSADGSWRSMEVMVDNLVDDPAVGGLVLHARDVTDQLVALAELDASNRRLSGLISGMSTAVVMADEHHQVMVANQAFADMFGLAEAPEDLVGATLASIGVSFEALMPDPTNALVMAQSVLTNRTPLYGYRIDLYDGRILDLDFLPMMVQDAFRGYLLLLRDVTDQARAEAERERLLDSEREENRRLAELDAYKSEFLASVSHELRTPLTSILAYGGLLRDLLEQRADPEEMAIMDVIQRNANRLLRLSGDLLMLDSLESGVLPIEVAPVDVGAVVSQAVRTIEPEAGAQGITTEVKVTEGPPLFGDADRLGQMVDNLLSNAVKFSPQGGRVSVTAEGDDQGWTVTVTDSGMGIPDDEQQQLFDRFFRASNATRRGMPGAGLGLSIAMAVAQLHRGTIEVSSTLGRGTTLTVNLRGIRHPSNVLGGSRAAGRG